MNAEERKVLEEVRDSLLRQNGNAYCNFDKQIAKLSVLLAQPDDPHECEWMERAKAAEHERDKALALREAAEHERDKALSELAALKSAHEGQPLGEAEPEPQGRLIYDGKTDYCFVKRAGVLLPLFAEGVALQKVADHECEWMDEAVALKTRIDELEAELSALKADVVEAKPAKVVWRGVVLCDEHGQIGPVPGQTVPILIPPKWFATDAPGRRVALVLDEEEGGLDFDPGDKQARGGMR